MSLSHRPIFHVVVAIPVVATLSGIFGRLLVIAFGQKWLIKQESVKLILLDLPYLVIVAWTSHQLRDSLRRGLSVWPFGNLPKTSYFLYILIIAGIPCIAHLILCQFHPRLTPKVSANLLGCSTA